MPVSGRANADGRDWIGLKTTDETILRGTLADIQDKLGDNIQRTALILLGPALKGEGFDESCLYAVDYDRRYRPQSADSPWASWSDDTEGQGTS